MSTSPYRVNQSPFPGAWRGCSRVSVCAGSSAIDLMSFIFQQNPPALCLPTRSGGIEAPNFLPLSSLPSPVTSELLPCLFTSFLPKKIPAVPASLRHTASHPALSPGVPLSSQLLAEGGQGILKLHLLITSML